MPFRLEELPCCLPPPQLTSRNSESPSSSSRQLPRRLSTNTAPRPAESSEGTLEGVLLDEGQNQQAEVGIHNKKIAEFQARPNELIIEEKESSLERVYSSDSQSERRGQITRVFKLLIQSRKQNMTNTEGEKSTASILSEIRTKKLVVQEGIIQLTRERPRQEISAQEQPSEEDIESRRV